MDRQSPIVLIVVLNCLVLAGCTKPPAETPPSEARAITATAELSPVGGLSDLGFMVGDWVIEESEFDADGERIEHITGGRVRVEPVLRGDWLQMQADGDVSAGLLWLFAHDPDSGFINAWAFSSGDAGALRARGGFDDRKRVEFRPLGDLEGRMRMTVEPRSERLVEVRIYLRDGEGWLLRTQEFWRR
jgi:hypothetical protein